MSGPSYPPAAAAELIRYAREAADALRLAELAVEDARTDLDDLIAEAVDLGVRQAALAEALGVTRETIRRATRRAQARKAAR